MNPLNRKIAFGTATAIGAELAIGGIADAISDNKISKEETKALNSIKGNSKKARIARRKIAKDYAKEQKDIDNKTALITAGAVIATGASGLSISKFIEKM